MLLRTIIAVSLFFFNGLIGKCWDMTGIILDLPSGVIKHRWEVRTKMEMLI